MKESKDIERLFQEKLKDLEMTPNPKLWNKIEQSIETPKKSKKGFIWWFSGTVAALLLIGLFLTINHQTSVTKPTISKENTTTTKTDSTAIPKKNILKPKATIAEKEEIINKNIKETITVPNTKNSETASVNIQKHQEKSSIKPKAEQTVIANNNTKNHHQPKQHNPETSTQKKLENVHLEKQNLVAVLAKEKVNKPNIKTKHWSIAPVVAELFYNTASNKSSVDNRLDNANKIGESSTSFGLKIAYQASKKWRIQTGVHRISMAQTTQNIGVASISRATSLAFSSNTLNKPNIANNEISVSTNNITADVLTKDSGETDLRQSYGYIEIPIEVNYQLFETNKLQFHLTGGVSSLFLTQNNLQIQNPNYSYSDGEATNLNDINFSLNLGTAVEYHFSNRWFFNLSPVLKMQTQTFNKSSNKPYLLGVSTGVNYKF